MSIYVQILSANAEKNLYIKTDGSENYNKNLLYLIYSAIPYSMRTGLSVSSYVHVGQHNTKLILCAELPDNMPYIDPITGNNNVMNAVLEKRTIDRNPFISNGVNYALVGKNDLFFTGIESGLRMMGDVKLNSMQAINLAYKFGMKQYDEPEYLPGMIYSWVTLPVPNTENWENGLCFLLDKAEAGTITIGDEIKKALAPRFNNAVTESLKERAKSFLN